VDKKRNAFEVVLGGKKQDDGTIVGGRRVVLVELRTGELRQAMELAGKIKAQDARQFETSLQGLRLSIRSVDGKALKYDELVGDKLDELFSVKEITLLAREWNRIHMPDDDEVDSTSGNTKAIAS
jgi:hypothetical protein